MTPYGILQPTDNIDASAKFLVDAGLKQKFRDGDRYAAFEFGSGTLALVAGEERIVDRAAPIYRVDDLAKAIAELTAGGAKIVRAAEKGPHEERAVLSLPGGGGLAVLSAKLK